MTPFKVKIITPSKIFYDGEVEMLIVRANTGDLAILKNHSNYVTSLDIGMVRLINGDKTEEALLSGGLLTVAEEETTILTEAAEWPHQIDLERAIRAKEHAEAVIDRRLSDLNIEYATVKLKKSISRIDLAERNRDHKY